MESSAPFHRSITAAHPGSNPEHAIYTVFINLLTLAFVTDFRKKRKLKVKEKRGRSWPNFKSNCKEMKTAVHSVSLCHELKEVLLGYCEISV